MISQEQLQQQLDVESLEAMAGDFSPRKYYRGAKDGRNFVVMVYPDGPLQNLGSLNQFVSIGAWFLKNGMKVPDIYKRHDTQNYLVMEDVGRISFGKHLRENVRDLEKIYGLSTYVLKKMATDEPPKILHRYRDTWIHKAHDRVLKFYWPVMSGEVADARMLKSYWSVWDDIERSLEKCPYGFVHMDFHLENLMYMPENKGIKQCAIIDYQDASIGPLPYDLVNLLEDARVTVPLEIKTHMVDYYCSGMSEDEKRVFLQWYRVLGTQFHCRVIGQFLKIAIELGRDDYLVHVERLRQYINSALRVPVLEPLREWFKKNGVSFEEPFILNGGQVRDNYRIAISPDKDKS